MPITFHCLFEQSGTFKNVFKDFGHKALDYDILNDYGETDVQADLFKEIENEFDNIVRGGGNTKNNILQHEAQQRFYSGILSLHLFYRTTRVKF